jgi:hypothetical protein
MTGILMDRYRFAPPVASDFPNKYDAGTGADPTLTDSATRGLVLDFGPGTISNNSHYLKAVTKTKPAGSNYDIIARLNSPSCFEFSLVGLCVTDGTKFVTYAFALTANASYGLKVTHWSDENTYGGTEPLNDYPISPQCEWLKLSVVGGDPKDLYVSANGTDWQKVLSTSMAGFLTFTEVGLVAYVNRAGAGSFPIASTNQLSVQCLYYKDPDIDPGF